MKHNVRDIITWYQHNKRVLPWRKTSISAYEVWVSEIMLQQTQVSRVIAYYERFLKKFPTVQKLANASWEEFLPYYEGLGYYARGRNMLQAAKIITQDFAGKFPKDKALLMKLPGVGEYTASAILSFAYRRPEIAFDTNFRKIFGTKEKALRAFKKSGVSSTVFNSAIMDYASAHSKSKKRAIKSSPQQYTGLPCVVVLHEGHKKYFSEDKKKYRPFLVPKNIRTREQIKKFFLEKYKLRVSVRPPNKNGLVNAQILAGAPHFAIFSKKEYDNSCSKWLRS